MTRRAFSLIEILVTLSLSGIMVGVLLTGYRNSNRRQTVTAAARRIRQILNEAKANATAYRIDCSLCGGDGACDGVNDLPLRGWEAGLVAAGQFRITGQCGTDNALRWCAPLIPATTNVCFMERTDTFTGVNIVSGGSSSVLFRPRGAGVTSATSYVISNAWGYSETVTVNARGLVQ